MTWQEFLLALQNPQDFEASFVPMIRGIIAEWAAEHYTPRQAAVIMADFEELYMRKIEGTEKTPQEIARILARFIHHKILLLQRNIDAEEAAREVADTALQNSLGGHAQRTDNPHNVTAGQLFPNSNTNPPLPCSV